MEKTLAQIEAEWNYREYTITDNIVNSDLANKFAKGEIIIEHTGRESDIWRVNLLTIKLKLSHDNDITFYGPQPIPYKEKYFLVTANNLSWVIPEILFKKKPIIKVEEIFKKYNTPLKISGI